LDIKHKNENLGNSVANKITPLEMNPLFDGKENFRNFIETGKKEIDEVKEPKISIFEKTNFNEKKEEVEDIYLRKKRLLQMRDFLLKKKQEEREKIMKNYQKVFIHFFLHKIHFHFLE